MWPRPFADTWFAEAWMNSSSALFADVFRFDFPKFLVAKNVEQLREAHLQVGALPESLGRTGGAELFHQFPHRDCRSHPTGDRIDHDVVTHLFKIEGLDGGSLSSLDHIGEQGTFHAFADFP